MDRSLIPGAAIGAFIVALLLLAIFGGLGYGENTTAKEPKTPEEETRQGEAANYEEVETIKRDTTDTKEGSKVYERSEAGIKQLSSRTTPSPEGRGQVLQSMASRIQNNPSPEGTNRGATEGSDVKEEANSTTGSNTTGASNYEYLGTFKLTAYTAGPESTGKSPGDPGYGEVAISGSKWADFEPVYVKPKYTIAADWGVLPPGTVVYIEGLGERVVEDKGAAVNGKHIDVFIKDLSKALAFGVQEAKVYIIEWGAY